MMYNKDDVIYILENNTTIRKGKIARKQGDNYIIQLIGSCGALTMPEDQLFESEEAAEKIWRYPLLIHLVLLESRIFPESELPVSQVPFGLQFL